MVFSSVSAVSLPVLKRCVPLGVGAGAQRPALCRTGAVRALLSALWLSPGSRLRTLVRIIRVNTDEDETVGLRLLDRHHFCICLREKVGEGGLRTWSFSWHLQYIVLSVQGCCLKSRFVFVFFVEDLFVGWSLGLIDLPCTTPAVITR